MKSATNMVAGASWFANGWVQIASGSAVDGSGQRIQDPGVAGVGGYIESTYRYDNFRTTDLD